MRFIILVIALFCYKFCRSQELSNFKLITAEYIANYSGIGNYTYLVAYSFSNGILLSKDTLGGYPTDKKGVAGSYVRFDLGKNFIYKDRFIISGIGNVIDAVTGKLIIEESDNFVEAIGDSLLFHRNNIIRGTGFLNLNLQTGEYKFINNKERNRDINFSPDQKHGLYIDRSLLPYKILLKSKDDKDTIVVGNAGNGPNLIGGARLPTICTYWLDNNSFLYTIHKLILPAKDEIYSEVSIRKYNIINKTDIFFTKLDSIKTSILNDDFYEDGIKNIIYKTSSGEQFKVDTTEVKLLPYPSYEYGFDFSSDNHFSNEYGQIIRYKESEIGRFWCLIQSVSKSAIAIEYGDIGSNLGYPKGLKIWTKEAKIWTTIDIPWLCAIIGVIEE